jgi:pyruvate dehydrogenase E2 component (dihydrolipoamide acetyltransferase)
MQIIMPKLGLTMTHGLITEWLKAPGDAVRAEEALCTYETEKVTLELPAPGDGVLLEILAPAGTAAPAGAAVCEFVITGEARAEAAAGPAPTVQPLATPKARVLARERGVDLAAVAGSGPGGRIQAADIPAGAALAAPAAGLKATPLARRVAAAEGVNLAEIAGTGPEGAITREDVATAAARRAAPALSAPAQPPPHTLQPLTSLRRTIAERMRQSAFTAPHVTLMTEAEATNLVSARVQLNQELAAADKISYNTLLAALAARALREHPGLNACWTADGIQLLAEINIALAVDTERGLMTPVLRGVDQLSLPAIQRGYAALAARAAAGKSLPDDFSAGTFTITNLGGLEIDGFTPIINPPQAAILGVGRIVEKPVAREAAVVIRPMLTLSLSFDHRVVDGAPAARFLQRIKQLVERPMALLLRAA